MKKDKNTLAWYNALSKETKKLLDLWEENDLYWDGPAWDDEPQSVELNCSTGAGEDMYINLHEISADALEEYVNDFDINEEVSIWWENGQPGRGVPFNDQGEHVEDYEDYLAWLRDIIDASRGKKNDISHQQQIVTDKLEETAKELASVGLTFTYTPKRGFKYHKAA